MIIEGKTTDVLIIGEDTSKKAKISQDKLAKLQYLLTKGLYKDPITAVIAEWTNNGIDSVVQAGKDPVENPVIVRIDRNSNGQYLFTVEDKGTGLDDRQFEDICMNYLESTKEEDNDTIGHFGIGMKSFLSLERGATFTCRKDGIERKYLVYEGTEFVNYDLVYEKPTTEENGVKAELVLNNWGEKLSFSEKAKAKLAYYDTAVLSIDGVIQNNQIFRNELFQWSTLNSDHNMHLCLKDVYYSIDWSALGIRAIDIPVAIRLGLGDGITPTPSRESYITNEKTKQLLLKKIGEVADWFVGKYNETVKNFKSFYDSYEYLGQTVYYVNLKDKSFRINSLLSYSSLKPSPIKIDGITMRDPNDYSMRGSHLFVGYSVAGFLNSSGVLKSGERTYRSKEGHILSDKAKTVLVSDSFRGNVKEYLKQKYGRQTMFLKPNNFVRKLGDMKEYDTNGRLLYDSECYMNVLDLSGKPKKDWDNYIKEWDFVVSSIVSTFKDETKAEDTQEFKDWVEAKKEAQRQARKLKGGIAYKGLGKQLGDVTMSYSYERYNKIHFGKKVYPIADLTKNEYLTVLVTEDDNLDLVKEIALCIKNKDKIRFALVGKKEIKKIPEHFQFVNFQKFMSRDCKPFMRMASAIKFEELLREYREVQNYKNTVFAKSLRGFKDDAKSLQDYVDSNLGRYLAEDMKNIIIDVADEHKLYDMELWDVYQRFRNALKKYDFINLLDVPSSTNYELTKRYEALINQILLFRKKYYNDLPEGAKIVFEPGVKTKTNELV